MENIKKKETDFTQGSIYKKLIVFSIPLLIGNLLQQVYFIADSIVVGQLIGKTALAAVGAASAVTVILIFFFQGIATGAGILISQSIGAGETEKIRGLVKASAVIVFVAGGILSIAGYIYAGDIMRVMSVPDDVIIQASDYLSIALGGILPMLLYNMGASVIQAMGDSKTPLYYLTLASILNVILDIVFVKNLGMDVEGTALATVIAQTVSAILIFVDIIKRLRRDMLQSESAELLQSIRNICRIGLPAGIQQVVIHLANIVIQNHINGIGSAAMAGWSVFCRIDTFVILPFLSYGIAIMTFTGQNYGAGKIQRIFDGVHTGMKMAVAVTVAISAIICINPEGIFRFFTDDEEVLLYACDMIWKMVPLYFTLAAAKVYSSAISGTGNSTAPMIINLLFMCVLRVIALPTLTKIIGHNMTSLYITFWLSWFATLSGVWCYYHFVTKKKLINMKTSLHEDIM